MFLSFLWANSTGILLPRKKFLFYKLGSFKLVALYLYVLVNTGLPVVLNIKETNFFLNCKVFKVSQLPVCHLNVSFQQAIFWEN